MGLLSGTVAVTRFSLSHTPEEIDFDKESFREIEPGSEVRESVGCVPFEPDAEYKAGEGRWFFRLRIDKVTPDPTRVQERVKEMVRAEIDQGAVFVGPKKRRKMKEMAEEELLFETRPRTKIIEACINGDILYVGSTAKAYLGRVMELVRRLGMIAEFKTPWIDRGDAEIESTIFETYEPGEAVVGARFLRALVGDREIIVEPSSGFARLQTEEARITLSGSVLKDLLRYIERGAELLSLKLLSGEPAATFKLDGPSFRVAALKIETSKYDHWTELLDERLTAIDAVFELLDRKYDELAPRLFHV